MSLRYQAMGMVRPTSASLLLTSTGEASPLWLHPGGGAGFSSSCPNIQAVALASHPPAQDIYKFFKSSWKPLQTEMILEKLLERTYFRDIYVLLYTIIFKHNTFLLLTIFTNVCVGREEKKNDSEIMCFCLWTLWPYVFFYINTVFLLPRI